MTATILMAMIGLALVLPVLSSDSDSADPDPDPIPDPTPDPPRPDPDPDTGVQTGTEGADRLDAEEGQIVNAFGGNDTLTADINAAQATLNGGTGDDVLEVFGTGTEANGNPGNDSITVDGLNITVAGGLGDDSISSAEDTSALLADGGPGNDALSAAGIDVTLRGGAGDDVINYQAASGEARGGDGNDSLIASASDRGLSGSLFGGAGTDELRAEEAFNVRGGAVLLDGGDDDDRLVSYSAVELGIREDTLTGGAGDDRFAVELVLTGEGRGGGADGVVRITDFTRGEDALEIFADTAGDGTAYFDGYEIREPEGAGYSDIILTYTSYTEGADPTFATIRLEGIRGLSPDEFTIILPNNGGTPADDILSSPGREPGSDDIPVISGLAGDDYLEHEGRDSSGPLIMEGGDGNDTLVVWEVEFGNHTTLNGGAGDDILRSDLFVVRPGDNFDVYTTGEGADRIEIAFSDAYDRGDLMLTDAGLMGRVTDFTPGEDSLVIDPGGLPNLLASDNPDPTFAVDLTLTEDPDGAFTDVTILLSSDAVPHRFTGTLRLEGLTDLREEDLSFAITEPNSRPSFPAGFGLLYL